ncbi:malonic semialdehyde reductase [Chromobacterium sphagni]|uniref:Putative NADH dehydrogenase/NAD(P)H nitroreductase BI344_14820 n=1 Tax=Chromobacterium sphagni TaxID=1903179 RepID=A0A1S1X562_9NEIS|nr:malonic semialdehyde reductase [Chromobacterium sphagni]OHX14585.1 malonic semialdehyde reductase [Chromobacterium sphagni]OHX20629.1 malonic semialdehyde reductase [Chromobacterium sphagni]
MSTPISHATLEQLFLNARTHSHWQPRPVEDEVLRQLFDLLKQCPTSANCSPGRFVFVKGEAAKQKLKPCLAPGNVDKTMAAPVCVIVAHDLQFYDHLPKLFPHADAKSWFAGNEALIQTTAFRNGTLQGAYLILAARSLGLDCGPMSGFDNAAVDAAFFPDGRFKSNFLINLGYGEADKLFPRSPRFNFDDACQIL